MSNRQDDALPVVAYRINAMEGQEVKPHWMYLAPGQHSWQHLSNFTADPLVRLSDAQSAIASLQARLDAAEKAVEFAEYMAKGGEQLMAAIKAEGALRLRRAESDDVADDDIYDAGVTVGEMLHGLECDIYEFRKRAARSAA